jgi:2-hydroxy-6-oxonona-2,4-dienedioate hydrolase/2-succinyl-6-hydroxy-2,4-cyclohexadiene-1-carboxylate synthase
MPKIRVNGIALHYQQLGQGSNVVMVHGITGNLAIWHLEIIPALMGKFRFTTYDLRGHGYSDVPPTNYTTADHANDLFKLLDKLGIESASVVGHSFGADVALHFAVLHPEKVERLVLIEPAVQALGYLRERSDWIGWKHWREMLAKGGVTVPPEKWYDPEYLVRQSIKIPKLFGFRKGLQRRSAPLLRLMDTTTAARDYPIDAGLTLEKINALRQPTLVVYGEQSDFLGTYEYLKDHLQNCTPLLMPDCEHYGPLEQPAMLIDALKGFLPRP